MNLKQLATKLRAAADILDDLIGIDRRTSNETVETARKLRAALDKPKKKYHLKGKHWTQKPENRAKVLRMAKRIARIHRLRRKAQKAANTKLKAVV